MEPTEHNRDVDDEKYQIQEVEFAGPYRGGLFRHLCCYTIDFQIECSRR